MERDPEEKVKRTRVGNYARETTGKVTEKEREEFLQEMERKVWYS